MLADQRLGVTPRDGQPAVNDIEPVMWVLDKRKGALANLVQRSYAGSLLAITARNTRFRVAGGSGIAVDHYREDSPRWQAVARSLSEMSALCRQAGIPFLVFVVDEEPASMRRLLGGGGA